MSPTTEDRLRAAFEAKAAVVTPAALDPGRQSPDADADQRDSSRWSARWVAPLLAAAAVIGVAIATAAIVNTPSAHHVTPAGPTNSVLPTKPTPSQSSRKPVPTVTKSPPPASAPRAVASCDLPVPVCGGRQSTYEPLWPFANYAAAKAWQVASESSGSQPWHLDAGQTALLFAQNYLGFTDITDVTSTTTDQDGVQIGVGYRNPNGQPHTAALLHLIRFGEFRDDSTAGWEVVGSDDTDFSLEQPAYGSQVSSPMTVGGHITGVDENIVVDVKDSSGSVLTGTAAGVAAGGQNSPWHASVSFHGSGVLTIVTFTGGHLTQHERFAIQGGHT
jgi:hypothetical protein